MNMAQRLLIGMVIYLLVYNFFKKNQPFLQTEVMIAWLPFERHLYQYENYKLVAIEKKKENYVFWLITLIGTSSIWAFIIGF